MCLVAFAIDATWRFPFVVAANRDEYYHRPTAALSWWNAADGTPILAGRDLEAGGTWMGLSLAGRLAMLTNVRSGETKDPASPSRGGIVSDWLSSGEAAEAFWTRTNPSRYNGFNLIAFDFQRGERFWASHHDAHPIPIPSGIHAVSNARLDTPWPKVRALKRRLLRALEHADGVEMLAASLFTDLADATQASDEELPATGVPLHWERRLSAAFIHAPELGYGTRCSTLLITERTGDGYATHVLERSFGLDAMETMVRRTRLDDWPPRSGDAIGSDRIGARPGAMPDVVTVP